MPTYEQRLETYHEKMAKITIEHGSDYHEDLERMLYWQSIGYGKPSIVDTLSNNYIEKRDDLELYFSWEGEVFRYLPERKGFMGKPSYRLVKNYTYFTLKDRGMEDYLSYLGEVMDARRDNLSWIGGK